MDEPTRLPEPDAVLRGPFLEALVKAELPLLGVPRCAARLSGITWQAARRIGPFVLLMALRRQPRAPAARTLRLLFEDLGPLYVKFGQFIASAPAIVGPATAEEFRSCLDVGPAVSASSIRTTVELELGSPIEALFDSFDEQPFAAGSISVVHHGVLPDGRRVAVKVLRPGVEEAVSADLSILEALIRTLAAIGVDQAYNLVVLIVGLREQLSEELDLRNEAATMKRFRNMFEEFGLSRLVVPEVHEELSGARVLTMEFLDGSPIDDLAHIQMSGADPKPLVRDLLRAWVLTGLRMGEFHADIHAGNLLLLANARLGVLDWGIVARMDAESHLAFRRLIEASVGIEEAWDFIGEQAVKAQGPAFRALGLTDDQIRYYIRATLEPLLTRPLREVSTASVLFRNGDDVVRTATHNEAPARTLLGKLKSMRTAARGYRDANRARAFHNPTMRSTYLSGKQLVYLEQYARQYMPDDALLGDKEFLRMALADGHPAALVRPSNET
jgi:predicted unusual protein kinase regulating ubiquinone biosynthesis (AarF/ABC1/UbiB family)